MSRTDFKNVMPPITESRLTRQYARIRERVPVARPRRGWAAWAVTAAALAALAVVLVRTGRAPQAILDDGAIVESGTGADGTRVTSVTLADGSRIELGASTRARLTSDRPRAIRVDLERGAVDIEATHVEGRTFVIGAGAYDVRVVGTHFAVTRDPGDRITVRVDRGVVEVAATTGPGETRRLAAGEQWSAPDGTTGHDALPVPEPSVPMAATGAAPAPQAAPIAAAPVRSAPSTGAAVRQGPRELFDEAQRARADGRPYDAARAFDQLRRGFPHDPRAALSAFELGRLRLDALGDPRGAEEALRDAISLGPSSPFREDAEARRVEALWRTGDAAGCASARAEYLARWPNGTYRRAVELGCGDR
jgi:transmembrane sensor